MLQGGVINIFISFRGTKSIHSLIFRSLNAMVDWVGGVKFKKSLSNLVVEVFTRISIKSSGKVHFPNQ